jgi:lipopolysaccharide/colanic/teichoic acid biosynthesis glycosyltransferase
MTKRIFDIAVSATGLLIASPVLLVTAVAIWCADRSSPFYIAPRVGRGGIPFRMIKFRSMRPGADRSGVSSTAAGDCRITPIGRIVRSYKIDELLQLWNVLKGDMSLVGPRPQVQAGVDLYTLEERKLLTVRPGITDPASIVFSDEGSILEGSDDPDLLYNQVIRPWKSRLALLYVERSTVLMDMCIIGLTVAGAVWKRVALRLLLPLLKKWRADGLVCLMASRTGPLLPYPPPGSSSVVTVVR